MGPEEQARVAEQFVSGVVERFGLTARTTVKHADEEVIEISIDGADLGILIGPKGSTLNALQELTRTVAQRRSGERGARLVVDVAGYRARRTAALEQFARQVAEEVRAAGVPRALEPMSAADRKTVHDALSSFEGVATSSEGEDPHRHVVVRPEEAGGAADDSAAESGDEHPEDEQPPEGDDHDAAEDELAADGSRPA